MQIVIAHSHLNPGGVTRIIESQIKSLLGNEITVLVGNATNPDDITQLGAKLVIIPELNYLENRKYPDQEARELLYKIHSSIKKHLNDNTILHFHNLNLGKNPIVTYAVYLLAKEGYKVFNHAHDFAEDRPSNLQFLKDIIEGNFWQKLDEVLYPKIKNYNYGVLNSFDFKRLITYGVAEKRIEWLPNPVTFSARLDIDDKQSAKQNICQKLKLDTRKLLVTYPVRVIQRKNIGEFILLAVLFSDVANFVVTQPPQNPVEIELYKKWLQFCDKERINIVFEAGTKVNFEELLIGSDYCITTSYKEGFGMVYLEPWLLNTPVVGRDIDFISKDFRDDGFYFPALYKTVQVKGLKGDFKDFGMEIQMKIISDVNNKLIEKDDIFNQNPVFSSLFKKVSTQMIEINKTVINSKYSLKGYGNKLQKRYKILVG